MQKLKIIFHFINKEKLFLAISIASYFLFFASLWNPQNFFWGSDAEIFHYPARTYLYEVMTKEARYPFWTERILLGFPLYADTENAYLNPVNILTIIIFGPILSFKIVHLLHYLIGSYAIKKILEKHNVGIVGWVFANTAFYFSFFFLNHGIHIDILMVAFMLPIFIWLVELFFSKPSFKLLILQALLFAYTIYWGHPQMIIPVIVGCLTYYLTVVASKNNLKIGFLYFIFFLSIGTLLALPQLYPSYRMYSQSTREIDIIDPTQGSLPPAMTAVTIFPFLYGRWHYYHGELISSKYTYTETYMYLGVTSFLVFIMGLLFLQKKHKFVVFGYACFCLFLIAATLRYLPGLETLPPISFFRYWTRFIFVASFGIGIAGAYIVSNLKDLNLNLFKKIKWLVLIAVPILYLITINNVFSQDIILLKANKSIANLQTQFYTTKDIVLWFAILTFVPLILLLKKFIGNKIAAISLVAVLLLDLRFYGQDVINTRITKYHTPKMAHIENFEKQRILFETVSNENADLEGNSALLFSSWSPYGYSQFIPNDYTKFFVESKIGTRTKASYGKLIKEADHKNLRQSGLTNILTDKGAKELNADALILDLIRDNENIINAKYIEKEEGKITFEIETNAETTIETNIKFDTNWRVKVNSQNNAILKDRNIFSNVNVGKGKNIIEFTYIPKDILLGLVIGISGTILLGSIAYKSKFWQ